MKGRNGHAAAWGAFWICGAVFAQPLEWKPGFGEGQSGMNGPLLQLVAFGDELVAVGNFFEAGGVRANFVAAWNGSSWRRLGTGGAFGGGGFANAAFCAAVYRGELYAGGFFRNVGQAGGTRVNGVARWDGVQWNPVGTGQCFGIAGGFSQVRAMTVHEDKLYVAGSFGTAGCVPAANIASWDGVQWAGLAGGGTDDFVNALVSHGGMLVVGGEFDQAGPLAARGLAAYQNGWVAIAGAGLGFLDTIDGLASIDGQLYAGGDFDEIAGIAAADVARYDGAWHPLGSGLFGVSASGFASYGGKLYVSGLFQEAGGLPVASIASWDGQAWAPLAGGLNGSVPTLAVYNGSLMAGGSFTLADGIPSARIARWAARCVGDFDGSGFIDFFDYLDFVTAFEEGSMAADVNGDAFVDLFDYLDFVEAFEGGC
jgi:hypothetical protein